MPVSMLTPRRFIFLVLGIIITLHLLLKLTHEDYASLSSLRDLGEQLGLTGEYSSEEYIPEPAETNDTDIAQVEPDTQIIDPAKRRANATFVLLCQNRDLDGVVTSIQQMEDRFNKKYNYPWVLLNDKPFSEDFKIRVRVLTDAPIFFGQIPIEHWYQPAWIDEKRAEQGRQRMAAQQIIYGESVPYRNMCRFNSGFFYHHELLKPYRYYWRVEPEVTFFCNLDYDPFVFMEDNDKIYGFTISLLEWEPTISTLWATVKEFMAEYPQYISPNNSMDFLSDDKGATYNLCHYWSNFEIADMDFWRGEAYSKFFDFLESKGGFYYERWGDAPVHSIGASLFASKDQVHFFRDIGYRHPPFQHCPLGRDWEKGRCACDTSDSFDYMPNSCVPRYEKLFL